MRVKSLSALLCCVILLFSSCTKKDYYYRDLPPTTRPEEAKDRKDPPSGVDCSKPIVITDESYKGTTAIGDPLRCHIATYQFYKDGEKWVDIAKDHVPPRRIAHPDSYTLSFVEMPETDLHSGEPGAPPRLLKRDQLDDLLAHLNDPQDQRQDVVVVFVHGWRHDAAIGNADVRQFRTILNYSRSALNSRCIDSGRYCDARLTGVFVSWRGRSYREPTSGTLKALHSVPAVLGTPKDRKDKSEELAGGYAPAPLTAGPALDQRVAAVDQSTIGHVLTSIQSKLTRKTGNPSADKMMVIGHSYGGNMLATYLQPKAIQKIHDHKMGSYMEPLLGDLVVLFNPAAEAEKWTSLQRAMRKKAGIDEDVNLVETLSYHPEYHDDVDLDTHKTFGPVMKWRKMFHRSQRPHYISLTATTDWRSLKGVGLIEKFKKHDYATNLAFPVVQFVHGHNEKEQRTTIGHLRPKYRTPDGASFGLIDGPPVGASHEFINNRGVGKKTELASSVNPDTAWCGTHDGWLAEAQKRASTIETSEGAPIWDSRKNETNRLENMLSPGRKVAPNNAQDTGEAGKDVDPPSIQIRHGLYLGNKIRSESVAQGSTPFWNMRAEATAVVAHAGYMNFPTLCGLHLLWLDDATKRGG